MRVDKLSGAESFPFLFLFNIETHLDEEISHRSQLPQLVLPPKSIEQN
jgi:hypothetical protein